MRLWVIKLLADKSRNRMEKVLEHALLTAVNTYKEDNMSKEPIDIKYIYSYEEVLNMADLGLLKNTKLLFAIELSSGGVNLDAIRILEYLNVQGKEKKVFTGSVGGIIVDGAGDLYTKDMGRKLAFSANMAGCSFPGKSLTEATGTLKNFKVLASVMDCSIEDAYVKSVSKLICKILNFDCFNKEDSGNKNLNSKKLKILAVHAGSRETSNTLCLWEMVEKHLKYKAEIETISVRNGEVWDCRGCKYETCLHFGEASSCFYGGVMVEKIYPAIIKSDILVMICPNYNDSISANLMAFVNRLTAVFRANDFGKKRVYAIIVSGYSGGDIVAQQIIGAISMNKNFILPEEFAMIETANHAGDIMLIDKIEEKAERFAIKMV